MDYEVIATLGRGGMGVVDLARDDQGREVALKRLTLKGSANEIVRAHQRFTREATVLSRLHHPNIVRLIEVVEEADEMVLVMPYLAGGSLADRVAQHGPAPPADVERLGERLLGALAAAHQAGIIHRDLKPANVLYDKEGDPMLADFGLAHTWDQTHGLTVAGMVVGTPGYMPPEQARDEPLTPATDIFALGATLLFAATGYGPYGSGDPGLLMVRAANGEIQPLPKDLPESMRGWLSSMLDPEPEYRPTAVALLTGYGLPPKRPTGWRRPRNVLAVSAVSLAAIALVAVGLNNRDSGGGGAADETATQDSQTPATGPGDILDGVFPDVTEERDLDPPIEAPAGEEPGDQDSEAQPQDGIDDGTGTGLLEPGDSVNGRFPGPDRQLEFVLPPGEPTDPNQECRGTAVVSLGVEGGAETAQLVVVDEDNEVRGSGWAQGDQMAYVDVRQDLCDGGGETLTAQVVLEEATGSPGSYWIHRHEDETGR